MKKVLASFALLALLMSAFVTLASPAHAGIPQAISYCQATGSASNPYVLIRNAPLSALIDRDGNLKQGGINSGDKVAPFPYDFGGSSQGTFPGQNWDETKDRAFLDNGCEPVKVPLTPPTLQWENYTCTSSGTATLVGGDPRVVSTEPVLDNENKTWTATFKLPAADLYTSYTWQDGSTKDITLTQKMADPTIDPLWDEATGGCRTPDTGGGISNFALIASGGALGLGMIFLGTTNFIGRRRNA